MENEYGKEVIKRAWVESLPKSCLSCPFLNVDNKLWAGKELGYVQTQWCSFFGEDGFPIHLESRWMDKRDDKCPLKLLCLGVDLALEDIPLPEDKDIPPEEEDDVNE
jgi:hypothetical protein